MQVCEDIIERYEASVAEHGWTAVSLRELIQDSEQEHFWPTLVELLRIRMEHQVAAGDLKGVERCVTEYPALRLQSDDLSLLAFEEYRLLNAAGIVVQPSQYQQQWQVDVSKWALDGDEYHLTEDDWRQANERVATTARLSSIASIRPLSARSAPRRRAVLTCGQVFGPFRILIELGSGALATVYLAEQLDLSARLVVLKVCSIATSEPQKIAQLQHPNIVQILSLHDVAGFQVLCMPYVGATTFADILALHGEEAGQPANYARTSIQLSTTIRMRQQEVQTLVDGVVLESSKAIRLPLGENPAWLDRWRKEPFEHIVCELLYQAACGLEHAHQQGFVHSDLKPANILIGDDGKARVVDFNVAQGVEQKVITGTNASAIGGTLPYMSPEHLRSLRENVWRAGPASDVYSLGVVAYQLLTGKMPFKTPTGSLNAVIDQCIRYRETRAPIIASMRASADLRSIIQKMLEPDISSRYQSASQLCEDLKRHIEHRPLKFAANRSPLQRIRKWAKRHPKLTSASTIGSLAIACILALTIGSWASQNRLYGQLSKKQLAEFRAAAPEVFVAAASRHAFPELQASLSEQVDKLLGRLKLEGSPEAVGCWEHLPEVERTGLACDLISLANTIEHEVMHLPEIRSVSIGSTESNSSQSVEKVAEDLKRLARTIDSNIGNSLALDSPLSTLTEVLSDYHSGEVTKAIEKLKASLSKNSNQPALWLLLGNCFVVRGDYLIADSAYASSLAMLPEQWQAWYCRAHAKLEHATLTQQADKYSEAAECFGRVIELRPTLLDAWYNRAICREQQGDALGALEDVDSIKDSARFTILASLFRARLYAALGRNAESEAALKIAYDAVPTTAYEYIELGNSRMATDPKQALQNLLEAERLRPGVIARIQNLQNLAYLSMEVVPDSALAAKITDDWVAVAPRSAVAVASRAVFRARQSQTEAAIADAQLASKLTPSAREWAQIASAYAIVAKMTKDSKESQSLRDQAFKLLAKSLQMDWKLAAEFSRDADLLTLREDPRFQRILATAIGMFQLPKQAQESSEKSIAEVRSE